MGDLAGDLDGDLEARAGGGDLGGDVAAAAATGDLGGEVVILSQSFVYDVWKCRKNKEEGATRAVRKSIPFWGLVLFRIGHIGVGTICPGPTAPVAEATYRTGFRTATWYGVEDSGHHFASHGPYPCTVWRREGMSGGIYPAFNLIFLQGAALARV